MADMRAQALDYAEAGYEVFPLRGKVPLIAGGRGVLDATAGIEQVRAWWDRWPSANIGGRVPSGLLVLDIDPRNRGHLSLDELEQRHGSLPVTRTSYSGRGDGGRHLWWLHPLGKVSSSRLGDGLDVKTHSGYVVLPPSIHPDSGLPYQWQEPVDDPAELPAWLVALMRPPVTPTLHVPYVGAGGDTIADALSWTEILPRDWHCLDPDPDRDGARWRHPSATAKFSATVRHGCLFVYSTNTPFTATSAGDPAGYTKLRAYAALYHRGDCKAAYRDLASRKGAVR